VLKGIAHGNGAHHIAVWKHPLVLDASWDIFFCKKKREKSENKPNKAIKPTKIKTKKPTRQNNKKIKTTQNNPTNLLCLWSC